MIAKNKRPAKFSTQAYTRCEKCGVHIPFDRKFKLCRVCFRELAYKGQILVLPKHLGNLDIRASTPSRLKKKLSLSAFLPNLSYAYEPIAIDPI